MTRRVFTEPYRRLLEDGRADGTLAPADAEEAADALFYLVGLSYRHLRVGRLPLGSGEGFAGGDRHRDVGVVAP